jgi:hypothetical protein
VLPIKIIGLDFLRKGLVNPLNLKAMVIDNFRIARGVFRGEWELRLYPESEPTKRGALTRGGDCRICP